MLECKQAVSPCVNFLAWYSHFRHLTVIGASEIFLFSQVTKYIKTNSDEQAVAELKSVILHRLSPVMPSLLSRLRNFAATGTSIEKCGVEQVMNQLVSLGRIVGL
jgi:hypothetical protein